MSIRPPEDADRAALAGRVWRDDAGGPSVVALREGRLFDVTRTFPTMTDLLAADDPAAALRAAPGEDLGALDAHTSLLAPVDLQAVKACGVTFASSMLERVIEEQARGDPAAAEGVRTVLAKEIGADHVINYTEESIPERIRELTRGRGVDVVVDHVGAQFFEDAYNSLKRGGRYGLCGVTSGYLANLQLGTLFTKQLQVFGVFMGSRADMSQVTQMLNDGRIKPIIHRAFPLEEAAEAHRTMEERSFFGKLVLRV